MQLHSPRTAPAALIGTSARPRVKPAVSKGRRPSVTVATAQTARAQAAAAAAAATTSAAAYTHAAPATSQAANAILARLEQPAALQPAELVPALRSAVVVACAGSRGAERAAPLLLGLAARAADVLASPPAAQGLGPEAPLLLLELLSQMAPQDEAAAAQRACLWRRAHCALGDAADVAGVFSLSNPHHMSPAQLLRYYEACARCPAAGSPSKSRGLGLLLRSHLHAGRFSPEECTRLLSSWAALRRRMPFNPDAYNFAELASQLCVAAGQLSGSQLQAVAAAAPAFEWPVYRSLPLLHAVCREAIHRAMAGDLALPAAQWAVAAAVKGASTMRPRFAQELEEAIGQWMRSSPRRAPPPPRRPTPAPLHGAALASAASEAGNNIVQAAAPWSGVGATALAALAALSGHPLLGKDLF